MERGRKKKNKSNIYLDLNNQLHKLNGRKVNLVIVLATVAALVLQRASILCRHPMLCKDKLNNSDLDHVVKVIDN